MLFENKEFKNDKLKKKNLRVFHLLKQNSYDSEYKISSYRKNIIFIK